MKKSFFPNLSQFKVVICSHIFTNGPTQALVEYLTRENIAREVLFIGHPLFPKYKQDDISFRVLYKNGRKIKKETLRNVGPFLPFYYLENFLLTIFWFLKSKDDWDLFIGVNNLNALAGLILKLLGRVKKVVFYVVDYTPKRFENSLMNKAYHFIDRICVENADEIWNLSPRMVTARRKFKNLKISKKKNKIVPMGIWFEKIKRVAFSRVRKHSLVFMGHLIKKQGIQTVIKAMPRIIAKIPDFNFLIIGKGEYEAKLKKIIKAENLEKRVKFAGYIPNHYQMERLMSTAACAVALYQKGDFERNFTYYTDPGKIKDYLGAGLPVILTDVPHNAFEIEKAGCGKVIEAKEEEVAEAVIQMMKSEKRLRKYRRNALRFAKNFDWNKIFSATFASSVKELK